MRSAMIFLLATALVLEVAAASIAGDYYVDCINGSDLNSGLWAYGDIQCPIGDGPWGTLDRACEMVHGSSGDPAIIHFAPGVYGPGFGYCYLPMWVELRGSGPALTTITISGMEISYHCRTAIRDLSFIRSISCGYGLTPGRPEETELVIDNCVLTSLDVSSYVTDANSLSQVRLLLSNCHFNINADTTECTLGTHIDLATRSGGVCLDAVIRDCTFSVWGLFSEYSQPGIYDWYLGYSYPIKLVAGSGQVPKGGVDRLVVEGCVFPVTAVCSTHCPISVRSYSDWSTEVEVTNCLLPFSGVEWTQEAAFVLHAGGGDISVSMRSSTVANADALIRAPYESDVGTIRLAIDDSVLDSTEFGSFAEGPQATVTLSHCCTRWPAEGEGVIQADPMFVSGPLGAYYLSQESAGQEVTSPCVDAGSGPASQSTVAGLTTRTDHLPDDEALDMGFHYGKQVGPKPHFQLDLDRNLYYAGQKLTAKVLLVPSGTMLLVDAYLGVCNSQIGNLYLTDQGWVTEEIPWVGMLPIVFLPTTVPEHSCSGLPDALGKDIRRYDLGFDLALEPPRASIPLTLFLELRDNRTDQRLARASKAFRIVPNAARYGY